MTTNTFRSHKMPPRSPWHICGLIVAALIALAPAAWGQSSSATGTYSVTTNGSVFIYSFTGSGTFTPSAALTASLLVVGGGGGGGGAFGTTAYANEGGGGGAGGFVTNNSVSLASGTPYTVTVGGGGTAGTGTTDGGSGGNSAFGSYTATGGGGGGSATTTTGDNGGTGGSGGGGGRGHSASGSAGSGTAGQGNGGAGGASGLSGGGGGAGASGSSYNGGNGIASSITGTSVYYAGGGAGGNNTTTKPTAGLGGGGAGSYNPSAGAITNGSPGTANTGGGGGGSFNNDKTISATGGSGGSGIVIVSYVDPASAANSTVSPSSGSEPADGTTTATITVTLKDSTGYLLPGKTVTLAQTGGSGATITTVSGTTSASGVASFTVKSSIAGAAVFTATDTTDSITVSQTATVTFLAVSIDHFTVTPSVSSTNAGSVYSAMVQAYATPGSGSPITNNAVDGLVVTMTSSGAAQFDGAGTGAFTSNMEALTNGTFTINVRDLKAESVTLTATLGSATGTSASVTIAAGAFTQLQVLLPGESAAPGTTTGKSGTAATETSGIGFTIIVNAVDTNWNMVTSSDTVQITAVNAPLAVLPANTALSGGTVTLNVTNLVAGSLRALTASDVSNTSISNNTSSSYTVVPGAAAQLLVLAPGETAAFGSAPGKTGTPGAQNSTIGYTVTVDALDVGYNLVTNCTDTVHISSTTGGDTLPANAALVGGSKTFSVTNNTVGTTTLTASDSSVGGVTNGSSTIPVNINSTTAGLVSSANPAYEGQSIKLTATITGAGLKTGTVTFKNGSVAIGTSTLSNNVATYNLTGGAGTYSLTATYNGDANNTASTSSTLSQVVQTGEVVVNPAQMQEGFDYVATNLTDTSTTSNSPVLVTNFGGWYIVSDVASNTDVSTHVVLETNDLAGATTPDIKPLPNQTTNVAEHLEISKGATDREFFRSIGSGISSGSAYFSFLLESPVVPVIATNEVMLTMLPANTNNYPAGNDPLTLYARTNTGVANSYNLGISRLGGSIVWATASLLKNTTNLIVVKYTFGGADSLYINPIPGASEPATPAAVASGGAIAEPANIGTILFYEAVTAPAPPTSGTYDYDVLRVDANWTKVTPPTNAVPDGATKLALSPGPQTLTANSNSTAITISLQDQSNNVITATANLTINLSSTSAGATFLAADDATVVSSVVLSNGTSTATFYYRDSLAGTPTVTAASGLLTPATQTETINPPPGLLDHFTVIPSTSSASAGSVFTATVQAYDSNNVAIVDTSLNGQFVTLSSSGLAQVDANGDGIYGDNLKALTNGTLTINVRDLKAESVTLTATLGTPAGTSSAVTITPDAVAQLQILLPGETATPGVSPGYTGTPSTRTAGKGYSITVNAEDTNWNVAASSDTVNLTAANDANAILPANTALVAGTKTLSVTNIIAGSGRTLTATDVSNGGITASTSPAYSVVAGPVAQLVLMAPGETPTYGVAPGKTGTPSQQIQTAPFTLTVNALDAYYNLANTATGTIHIASSDSGATVTTNTALYAGAATFSITQSTTGSVTDTASDVSNAGVTAASTTLTVDVLPRYRTVASGNWSSTSTWQYSTDGGTTWNPATSTPSSSTAALTEITNGVTVTVASSVVIDRTTIDAGGMVSVPSNVTLSVVPGSGTDLDVFGSVVNAGVVTNLNGNVTFEAGSLYNLDEDNGVLPTATWNSNSTCEVTGWAASTTCSEAMGLGQLLGNFVWNSPGMTANLSLGNSKFNGIAGNFEVLSTGSGVLNIVQNGSLTNNIGGSVIVTGGNLDLDKGDGTIQFNVAGNVTVGSGAIFDATPITGGSATVAFNTGTHILSNTGTISGLLQWVVNSSATLDLGTAVIGSTNSFTLNPGAGVITAKATGLAGNLTIPTNDVSLSTSGNYTYDGAFAQSGDTLLPAAVASLTLSNNLGLVLHQATTATNMALIASPLTGNLTIPNSGAMTVSGGGCSVTGNLSLNTGSLTLVSSNNFPQLTIIGGTASLNGGSVALTVLGAPMAEGTYLLVNATSGGTVGGTLPALVNLSGTGLPSWTTGIPQITGGKLYVSYQNYFSAVDNGPGFFSGENLEHEDVSGRTFLVWSTSDPTQPVSTWTLEGPAVEFPISGSSPAMSEYGITVTPSASPMYYVLAQTNIGPFSATEPLITLTTSDYVTFNVGATNTAITSGGVFELIPPVITPVTITPGSAQLSGGAMTFAFTNATGLSFTILATNNLSAPITNWPAIGTAVESPSGSGSYQFTDPAAATNLQRFYLLRQP